LQSSVFLTAEYVELLFAAAPFVDLQDKLLVLEIVKLLLSGVHAKYFLFLLHP
jgi:hypothetical protein